MADKVLFIGWKRPIAGRERQGLETFRRCQAYYEELKANKKIEGYDIVLLDVHGGDLNNFVLVRGTADQIGAIRRDEEFIHLIIEAEYLTEGLGIVEGRIGEGATSVLTQWSKVIGA